MRILTTLGRVLDRLKTITPCFTCHRPFRSTGQRVVVYGPTSIQCEKCALGMGCAKAGL